MTPSDLRLLFIEPYDSGSHAAFRSTLSTAFPNGRALCMPGRHWKWRMRGSAVWAALRESELLEADHELIVASSYLPLAELRGLVPRLATTPAILYFHENQLAFPSREEATPARDLHFAFTQLVSALAAQRLLFNSEYNRQSFFEQAGRLLSRMPDKVPSAWLPRLEDRSEVLHFPVDLRELRAAAEVPSEDHPDGPLVLWNHRWEHDKNPEEFFAALEQLHEQQIPFRLAVCGQRFEEAPPAFDRARRQLASHVVQFGTLDDRADYLLLLARADLVVSTAVQEFFGVSVVEAVAAGARPLVPDHLAYPELWPQEYRYPPGQLAEALARLLRDGRPLRASRSACVEPLSAQTLLPRYVHCFEQVARER